MGEYKEIAVGIVWNQNKDCVLVGLRESGLQYGGYHEFPGGKIEPGESPQKAVIREVLEETGYHVNEVTHRQTQTDQSHSLKIYFFDCRITENESDCIHPEFSWVAIHDLDACKFPPANDAIVRELVTGK